MSLTTNVEVADLELPEPQRSFRSGMWLPAEDACLREAVTRHGTRWALVAAVVNTRSGDQCAKRWNEKLNPELDHSPWTPEEEEYLLTLVGVYGHNWKFMSNQFFQTRAPLALRNRHSLLVRRLKRQGLGQRLATTNNIDLQIPQHVTSSVLIGTTAAESPIRTSIVSHTNLALPASVPEDNNHTTYLSLTTPRGDISSPIAALSNSSTAQANGTTKNDSTQGVGSEIFNAAPAEDITVASNEQDRLWHQPFIWSDLELDDTLSFEATYDPNETGNLPIFVELIDSCKNRDSNGSSTGEKSVCSTAPPEGESSDASVASHVKYSITCARENMRSVVKHLVDAAMEESADCATEKDQVTLTLQLQSNRSD